MQFKWRRSTFWEERQLHEKCKRRDGTSGADVFMRRLATQPRLDEYIYRDEYFLWTEKNCPRFMTEKVTNVFQPKGKIHIEGFPFQNK